MKLIFFLFITMNLFTSCQEIAGSSTPAMPDFSVAESLLNVPYGPDSLQRMDVYLPAGRSDTFTKSIVLIHGGGWNAGSKSDFATYIDTFKTRLPGYAIFNIDYRLATSKTIFPMQEEDVKTAMNFIAKNSRKYGIGSNEMALMGASAGAHLALLQAYKYTDVPIKAVVDFFGPTDLITMYNKPWHSMIPYLLQMLTGTTPSANLNAYKASSPVSFVTPGSPPTLILHGGSDHIVDPSQSKLLAAKLKGAGVDHELVIYPGERHGWYGTNLINSFDRIQRFLEASMR